ncbi:ParB/RepB/Spo0J family partition protein [Desulfobacter curvatus]|uniref:ParB/RepB/Spo0J family partition protein n=1 Tax=Desulfobacter curvatus TaxID=2290 RepID=UPI00037037A3|nr:ParB/RepB/Spo0J family partition protein [Desulfobacter curvatus]
MEKKDQKLEIIKLENLIKDPNHPRQESGNLESLTESLKCNGLLNPITVVKVAEDKYHVVDGWRRIEALKTMDMEKVSCVVYEDLKEANAAHLSYVLNTKRSNLTPIEKALHIKGMIEKHGLTYTELEALGYGSQAQVSKFLGLLKLPSNTQKAIADGTFTVAHGTALLKAQNPDELTKMAIKRNWSAAKITRFIKDMDKKQNQEIKPAPARGVTEGADTSKISDGSVDFICSVLDSGVFSHKNRSYLYFQTSEANRILTDGGILALILHKMEDVASVIQCLSKKTASFDPVTEFTIQFLSNDFENKAKESVQKNEHAGYTAQTASHPILIFKKVGSRKISPALAEESKLSEKEAVECLRSGWIFENEKATIEDLLSRLIRMYSFKEDIVLDLFSMNKVVLDVAEKLGRGKFESMKEFVAKQLETTEENQTEKPKAEVIMSEEMAEAIEEILARYRKERDNA